MVAVFLFGLAFAFVCEAALDAVFLLAATLLPVVVVLPSFVLFFLVVDLLVVVLAELSVAADFLLLLLVVALFFLDVAFLAFARTAVARVFVLLFAVFVAISIHP